MTRRYDDPRLELAIAAAATDGPVTHLSAAKLGIRRLGGIEQLTKLRWLDLSHNPLASVAELGGNTRLRRVILQHTGMSTLRGLEGLAELEDLDLYASRVISIDELAGLGLRSLDLGLCIAADLGPLAMLTKLESLTLGNPRQHVLRRTVFSAPSPLHLDLNAIRRLSSLRQLRLCGLKLSTAMLLDELVGLEELVLEHCEFGDQLRDFPELPRLELLNLTGCNLPDLRALTNLPSLRTLELDEAKLIDLEPLLGCPALEHLSLRSAEIGDLRSVWKLRAHPRLGLLRLDHRLVT